MRRFGKAAMAAAGSPGHFPLTAVPGGVRALVDAEAADKLAADAPALRDTLVALAREQLASGASLPIFHGADVALVDRYGSPDLVGDRLRAVTADGGTLISGAAAAGWDSLIAELVPGAAAPRPYLMALGPENGRYRVGPVAQLRVGELTTPIAAELQAVWLAGAGDAAGARAIMTVHAVEAIIGLLETGEFGSGEVAVPVAGFAPDAVGVGWVDGPRGLLVHRYQTGADGRLASAQILTPTAQNEPWLAELLLAAASGSTAGLDLEDAVREADPCLPCSSAPVGGMGLQVDTVAAEGGN